MMLEIMKKGPVTCSFEPGFDFMMFSGSGIYHNLDDKSWIRLGMKKPEWSQVDHSVLCVGWGETDSGRKYWIIQNTWGKDWGKHGYFRMKKGEDTSGIESIGVASDP